MSTTLTTLALTIAAEKSIVAASAKLAPLKAFSTGFKAAETTKGTSVVVPLFAAKTAAAYNASSNNYGSGSADVAGVSIALDKHYVASSKFEDIDFAECDVAFWEGAGAAIGKGVAKGILAVAFANITAAKFTKSAKMAEADAANLKNWALLRKAADDADFDASEACLLLSSTYFAYLLSLLDVSKYGGVEAIKSGEIPGLFGFKAVIDCPTLQTTANLVGAIAHPQSIGVAGRLLKPQSAKCYDEIGYSVDEASGLAIGWRRYGAPATGTNHYAGEALFGAEKIDGNALVRIISA